ncbi:MAG: SH3 domain-containing protein [Candidatus Limivivens sp.]|nr:SH3 domain-containing protein [Candidatus Limivivens sp.]
MKNRSKLLVLLTLTAAAFSLASCGKKPEEIQIVSETPTETEAPQTEKITEAPTEPPTEAPTEPETEPAPTYKVANGTIQEVAPDTITIFSRKGKVLTFNTAGKELYFKNGISGENEVQVRYEGEITESDASGVTVIAILDGDKDAADDTSVEAVSQTVYTLDDVNVRAGASTDAAILGGIPKGHSLEQTGKVGEDWIQISYAGREAYVFAENITTKKEEAPETEMGLDDYSNSEMIKTVSGTITAVNMNTISILSDNGNDLSFSIYGAAIHVMNGLDLGNYLTIEYNGEISDDNDTSMVWVISVKDSAAAAQEAPAAQTPESNDTVPEAEAQTPESNDSVPETGTQKGTAADEQADADQTGAETTVRGLIQNATQTSVTILTEDGASLIFAHEGAETELADGLQIGNYINVTYDPGNVYESGVYDAIRIADAD